MPAISFDAVTFINTLLGALVGGLISVAVSFYFFVKGKGLESLTSWMAGNLGDALIRQAVPQFFGAGSFSCEPNEPAPRDLDVPHLNVVLVNHVSRNPGQMLEILFRVSDHGWNFPMAAGVKLIDSNGDAYAAKDLFFGYMQADVTLPVDQPQGKYQVTFHMVDSPKAGQLAKRYEQSIDIDVRSSQ